MVLQHGISQLIVILDSKIVFTSLYNAGDGHKYNTDVRLANYSDIKQWYVNMV